MKPTYKKTNSFLLCMDLQPYSHDCFSKNIKNYVWFPKQYLLGFFILEKQLTNIPDRGFLFLHNTLLLYIPLLALTDRQTDRESNTLAARGLEELFSSCAVLSVFGSGGK